MAINLLYEGKWLEKLGFRIGDRLQVEYGDQCICISHAADTGQPLTVREKDAVYASRMAGSENLKIKNIKVTASMHVRKRFAGGG